MSRLQLDRTDWWAVLLHSVAVFGAALIVSVHQFILDKSVLAAFVQVYVMLTIFAMGAPELLLNTVGRDGVRKLVQETFRFPRSGRILVLFLGFGALTSATYEAFPESIVGDRCALTRVIVVTLVASLSATLLSVLSYVRNFQWEKMVRRIGGKARECLGAPLPKKPPDRVAPGTEKLKNTLGKALRSLEQLGAAGRTHAEWGRILRELCRLAAEVTRSDRYGGNSLEAVIRSVVSVIKGNSRFTSAKNMVEGLNAVEAIQGSIRATGKQKTEDERRVQEALFNVSTFILDVAIETPGGGYEGVVERAISSLEDQPARQFVLLRKTLDLKESPLRQKAAILLRAAYRSEEDPGLRIERCSRLAGFAALLREQGRAEQRWVKERIVTSLDGALSEVLAEAYEWMFKSGEFSVASALDRWREEVAAEGAERSTRGCSSPLVTINVSLFGRP